MLGRVLRAAALLPLLKDVLVKYSSPKKWVWERESWILTQNPVAEILLPSVIFVAESNLPLEKASKIW